MADTSFGERIWIVQGVEQDLRTDGRSRSTYRPLGVEANIIAQADGSARLHLGSTDVLVGVKVSWQLLSSTGSQQQQHWQDSSST
jgi:exosome complex component RRP42